jgi:hypothetical protein
MYAIAAQPASSRATQVTDGSRIRVGAGDGISSKTARLPKRLRRVEELPPADQRAVLKLVDAMLETRRRSRPPSSARKRKAS